MSDCKNIDPLVTPYVDDELAEGERQHIERHLRHCPPCHSRVAAERAVRDTIRSRRSEMARPCAPPSLRAACATTRARLKIDAPAASDDDAARGLTARRGLGRASRTPWTTRVVPFALAASLVVLVSGAFVYQLTDASATVMAAELTADHLKCFAVNSMMGTHETPAVVESAMLAGFGWRMHLPEDPAAADLQLVGSRPCFYGEGKIAHLMYRHQGHPVSVFMLPKSTRAEQFIEVLGHEAKIWCDGNRTLVLIAREPRRNVERLASFVQASLH